MGLEEGTSYDFEVMSFQLSGDLLPSAPVAITAATLGKAFETELPTELPGANRCVVQRIEPARLSQSGTRVQLTLQRPSGGIPAWDDAEPASERADATAQSIRLWLLVSPASHAAEIERARQFLARLQAPSGGMLYESEGHDENSWCSAFALQAEAWCERGSGSAQELF